MRNLFQFVGLRHLRLKPMRTILTTLGVAFGIALYIAISIINYSTRMTFRENIEAVSGKAKLTVTAGDSGFPEEKLEIIRNVPGVKHAVPMVESRAYFAQAEGSQDSLFVLGVDLLQEQAVRTYKATDQRIIDDPLVFLNQPDSIVVTKAFAAQHGLALESKFSLSTISGPRIFTVRGLLEPEGAARAYGGGLAIMDIDGARVSFGKEGRLDRVDLVPQEGVEVAELATRIETALGVGYQVESPGQQGDQMERMVASYQVMLSFFSSLALLVGLFLVANSINVSVAERRREIGILRALGATKPGILAVFLAEAFFMGLVGALLGTGLGRFLASFLVTFITDSLSAQYLMPISVTKLIFTPGQFFSAVVIGTVTAFLAALYPSLRAASIAPLEAMKNRGDSSASSRRKRRAFFGLAPRVGLVLLGFLLVSSVLGLPTRIKFMEQVNQLAAMLGAALLGPFLVTLGVLALRRAMGWVGNPVFRLALENLLKSPARTNSNVMALMVGLVLVMLVATVRSSFKDTALPWMEDVLAPDLIVSSSGRMITYEMQPLEESVAQQLYRVEGVKTPEPGRGTGVRLQHFQYQGKQLALKAFDYSPEWVNFKPYYVTDGDREQAVRRMFESPEPSILVSENFTLKFKLTKGDTMEIETPQGLLRAKIVGTIVDFASSEGVIYMSRAVFKQYWSDPLIGAVGLHLKPGEDLENVRRRVNETIGRERNLITVSNAELRGQMVQAMDQGFAFTRAIEIAALAVALVGLLNTLLISVLERTRELGMLRAVGMSSRQLFFMILAEAAIQGLLGAIVAVGFGAWIAYLWIKYSLASTLGWIVGFHFPWNSFWITVVTGVAVAILAGFYPSRRASRLQITEALEYE